MHREGDWRELVGATEEWVASVRDATPEALPELLSRIRPPAKQDDAQAAQKLYERHKPDGSILIGCDIALPAGTGIINCRVDGEHKQIRF